MVAKLSKNLWHCHGLNSALVLFKLHKYETVLLVLFSNPGLGLNFSILRHQLLSKMADQILKVFFSKWQPKPKMVKNKNKIYRYTDTDHGNMQLTDLKLNFLVNPMSTTLFTLYYHSSPELILRLA